MPHRPFLDRQITRSPDQDPHDPHTREWLAHIAAGRIGNMPPPLPGAHESLRAADALFRRIAADRRRLAQAYRA